MPKNLEKPCFTFFAFLPPYFGVSGSLVSGMRKSVKRSIDWYQKFLISGLAARYSTVFVLRRSKWRKITTNHVLRFFLFTPLYRRFRLSRVSQTQEREEIYRLVSTNFNFMPCGSVFDCFCVLWKNVVES